MSLESTGLILVHLKPRKKYGRCGHASDAGTSKMLTAVLSTYLKISVLSPTNLTLPFWRTAKNLWNTLTRSAQFLKGRICMMTSAFFLEQPSMAASSCTVASLKKDRTTRRSSVSTSLSTSLSDSSSLEISMWSFIYRYWITNYTIR